MIGLYCSKPLSRFCTFWTLLFTLLACCHVVLGARPPEAAPELAEPNGADGARRARVEAHPPVAGGFFLWFRCRSSELRLFVCLLVCLYDIATFYGVLLWFCCMVALRTRRDKIWSSKNWRWSNEKQKFTVESITSVLYGLCSQASQNWILQACVQGNISYTTVACAYFFWSAERGNNVLLTY